MEYVYNLQHIHPLPPPPTSIQPTIIPVNSRAAMACNSCNSSGFLIPLTNMVTSSAVKPTPAASAPRNMTAAACCKRCTVAGEGPLDGEGPFGSGVGRSAGGMRVANEGGKAMVSRTSVCWLRVHVGVFGVVWCMCMYTPFSLMPKRQEY